MRALTFVVWFGVYASVGWGVIRFFRRDGALTPEARTVAVMGVLSGAWHLWAMLSSAVTPARYGMSTMMMIGAGLLFWSAVAACRSRPLTAIFSGDLPLHMVSRGPYRWIRHPFYAAYSLFWFAGALASASPSAVIPAVVMLTTYIKAARQEEAKFARSSLAMAYHQYRSRTGFLTPRIVDRR